MLSSPVFICGALRSGTTMLHLMLNAHPHIKNPGEFDFLFDRVTNSGSFPDEKTYIQWLSTHRIFLSKPLQIDENKSFASIVASFIEQLYESGKVTALNVHRRFDVIPYLFPESKYIHMIRDPRDVARSSIGMGWVGNVYYGIDHWLDTEWSWQRLKTQIEPTSFLEIKFEELVTSPEVVLTKVCQFLGVEYSDAMLEYTDNSNYEKPDKSLTYQWKKKQSQREVQLVESKAQDLIKKYGYELSGYPPIELSALQKIILWIQNKFFRINFNIKRYGIMLYVLEQFSSRFKIKFLHNIAKTRINKIDIKHLR